MAVTDRLKQLAYRLGLASPPPVGFVDSTTLAYRLDQMVKKHSAGYEISHHAKGVRVFITLADGTVYAGNGRTTRDAILDLESKAA